MIEQLFELNNVDYVITHIIDPLGLNRSVSLRDQVEEDPDRAIPYYAVRAN